MRYSIRIFILIGLLVGSISGAQTKRTTTKAKPKSTTSKAVSKPVVATAAVVDPDVLFKTAKDLATNGKRDSARVILKKLTTKFPLYYDAYVLAGRTYAWDGNYTEAQAELDKVLFLKNDIKDAYLAKMDAYYWDSKSDSVVAVGNRALKLFPGDSEILTKKAKALVVTGNSIEAEKIVKEVVKKDTSNFEAKSLYAALAKIQRAVAGEYLKESYGTPRDQTYHVLSFEYIYKSSFGAVIPRVNIRDITAVGESPFSKDYGFQFEIDAYPHITKYNTLYLNAGYSNSSLFPSTRLGIELYQKLGTQSEISLGVRNLNYNIDNNGIKSNENIVFYTGSLSLYKDKWYASYRPFVKFNPQGNAVSNVFVLRRYLEQPYKYFNFQYVTGHTPDEFALVTTAFNVDLLKSNRYRAGISWPFENNWVGALDLGYYNEQISKTVNVEAYMMWIRVIKILK